MADASPPDELRCTATARHTGQRCGRRVAPDRTTCSNHGGRVPRGSLSVSYKHGKYSNNLPGRLMGAYQASLQDPHVTSMGDALALCDARIDELSGELEDADGPGDVIAKARRELRQALNCKEGEAREGHLVQLEAILGQGAGAEAIWAQIMTAVEQRRRVAETESRRIVSMGQAVPIAKVVEIVGLVCQSFRNIALTHADRETANLILRDASRDVNRIIGAGGVGGPVPGGRPSAGPADAGFRPAGDDRPAHGRAVPGAIEGLDVVVDEIDDDDDFLA